MAGNNESEINEMTNIENCNESNSCLLYTSRCV